MVSFRVCLTYRWDANAFSLTLKARSGDDPPSLTFTEERLRARAMLFKHRPQDVYFKQSH